MHDDAVVVGDEPLVNGMHLSVRLRRDFTVTDAAGLLAAARRIFRELHPDAGAVEATQMVTCAATRSCWSFEQIGLIGDTVDDRLSMYGPEGLAAAGGVVQVVTHEPDPLRPGWDCSRTDDVFALPPS